MYETVYCPNCGAVAVPDIIKFNIVLGWVCPECGVHFYY